MNVYCAHMLHMYSTDTHAYTYVYILHLIWYYVQYQQPYLIYAADGQCGLRVCVCACCTTLSWLSNNAKRHVCDCVCVYSSVSLCFVLLLSTAKNQRLFVFIHKNEIHWYLRSAQSGSLTTNTSMSGNFGSWVMLIPDNQSNGYAKNKPSAAAATKLFS